MKKYNHVLLAVDLTEDSDQITAQAKEIAETFGADLRIIHVVEPLPGYGYAFISPNDIETELAEEAKKQLNKLAEKYKISEDKRHVMMGPTKVEILDCAKQHNVDLILVGSHGRHGLGILLGSTANAVIHGAECDVLTIRVPERE